MLIDIFKQLDKTLPIRTASDGREALAEIVELTDEELPVCVILDYKMPYMNAGEVLEALAREERYRHITKIVWSTSNREEDVNRCMMAGASHYFVKPSRFSELKAIAQQMLQNCKVTS